MSYYLTERAERKAKNGYFWENRGHVHRTAPKKAEEPSKKFIFVTSEDLFGKLKKNLKKSGFLELGRKEESKNQNLSRKSG